MKFLHISDIHFDPKNDGTATRYLREKFEDYVKNKGIVDIEEIFFTGDFRHAVKQAAQDSDIIASNAVQFLRYIAKCVGITDNKHIHIVPGNHDLDRGKNYKNRLKKIYRQYEYDAGQFDRESISYLRSRFSFFEKCAALLNNDIWKDFQSGLIHRFLPCKDYAIIYLNTAIASGIDDYKHSLLIGFDDLDKAIRENKGKPLFILAHNPLSHLENREQNTIKNLLKDNKAPVIWFCGDTHKVQYDRSYDIACVTVGCMLKERGVDAGFFVGEFTTKNGIIIRAHGYSSEHNDWQPEEAITNRIAQSIPHDLRPSYTNVNSNTNSYTGKHQLLTASPQKVNKNNFLYRESEKQEILSLINAGNNVLLVNGLGGIGKTAVARSLYHELKDSYQYAAWIDYNNTLKDSLLSQLHLYLEEKDAGIRYRQIELFLSNEKSLLLFVDNVNKTAADDASLKLLTSIEAAVIVTSRISRMEHFQSYEIHTMNSEQCIDIFYTYYSKDRERSQIKTVEELVKMVNCHTLSVELLAKAGNAIDYPDLTVFLSDLKSKGFGYPDNTFITDHTAQEATMAEHLVILFNMIDFTAEQKRVLKNFAWTPSMVIPAQIWRWLNCDKHDLNRLIKFGWLQMRENGYEMPDIVKEAVHLQSSIEPEDCEAIVTCICKKGYFDEEETYLEYAVKIKLADAYVDLFKNHFKTLQTGRYACLLSETATAYYRQGNYIQALEYFQDALSIFKKVLGEQHSSTATTYNNIAGVYQAQGDYERALVFYQKALAIKEKVLGDTQHPSTATSYNNIAGVYQAQGNYVRALEYYQKALAIFEKVLDAQHSSTATTYNNIAGVYQAQGNYVRALEYYQKALDIREKVLGVQHPDTASSYNNIAGIYQAQCEYVRALEFYQKTLAICEKVLGAQHPNTAITYNNIAGIYQDQSDYDRALEFYQKALDICEKVLGEQHPFTAPTYNNIAGVYQAQGDYDRAMEFYQKALAICEKVLGAQHPNTAITYNNIAKVYQYHGDYEKALEFYQKALDIREKVLGAQHPDTASSYNNIAGIYQAQGDYDRALEFYQKALDIKEKVLGAQHPDTAASYNNIAGVYKAQGDFDRALEFYQKALDIKEKVLGAQHPDTATSYNNIAAIYQEQGDFGKSLQFCLKAYHILLSKLGKSHPYTKIVIENMKTTYEKKGSAVPFEIWLYSQIKD